MRNYDSQKKPTPEHYCAYCGKQMERKRFPNGKVESIKLFLRRKYCNRDCMRKAFVKDGDFSQEWRPAHQTATKVAYIINGKGKVCQLCGATKNVDVHHIDGNYQNNTPDNLMIVCRSCHMKLHNKKSVCKICGKPIKGHGYCNVHYIRYKRYGNPLIYQGKLVSSDFCER
jgi:hypothetical protein